MADPRNHRMPPVGVNLTTDVERRVNGFRARVRWTDPSTHKRVGRVSHVHSIEEVEEFFDQMRAATETGNDPTITLAGYAASIGDRWQRGLDPTSTAEHYESGLRLRVLPALGHIHIAKITAGMIDRTIDAWEAEHSPSTIKNSIAPLVRVLDEAVRDDIIAINPAKHRVRRNLGNNVTHTTGALRQYALPDLATLRTLAGACTRRIPITSCSPPSSPLAAQKSPASGSGTWTGRTTSCGSDASTTLAKAASSSNRPKAAEDRPVPMLDALTPVLERLTTDKRPDDPLLRGPRGGVLTTATVRDATHGDELVAGLGLPDLTRHGLRHTGATWMADTGIALHALQEILGHQSIETTKGYLHPDHRHLAEAARQANQFLSAAPHQEGHHPPRRTPPVTTRRPALRPSQGSRSAVAPAFWCTSRAPFGALHSRQGRTEVDQSTIEQTGRSWKWASQRPPSETTKPR